ncbi:MAG: ABC transporter substrate-binding protein [Actinomycetia bacterium]|nr:ABC transporter substrate-binding protein [Actinomycetes bacterium]
MKKLFVWLLIVVFAFSMISISIGCKEEAAPAEPKTIVYWSWWNENEDQADFIKEWVEGYEKLNPTITIEVEFVGRDLLTKFTAARAGGEVIDIIEFSSDEVKLPLMAEGEIYSMDEALETPNDYEEGAPLWKDNFVSQAMLDRNAVGGEILMIPYNLHTWMVNYDKKLFRDNDWTVPETWDEFMALCETIKTTTDISPLATDGTINYHTSDWVYMLAIRTGGPEFYKAACEDPTGKSFDDPRFKDVAEKAYAINQNGYFQEGWEGSQWPNAVEMILAGTAAMKFEGTWAFGGHRDKMPEDFEGGQFGFPEVPGGLSKNTDLGLWVAGWMVLNDSEVAPEAIDFLKYCTVLERQQKFASQTFTISPIKDVVPEDKTVMDAVEALNSTDVLFDSHDGIMAGLPEYFNSVYLTNNHLLVLGEITPDEFIEAMKKGTIEYWENQ